MDRKEQLKQLLSNTNALLGAMRTSTSTVSGETANIGRYSSYKTFMRKYNELVKQATPLLADTAMLGLFILDKIKGWQTALGLKRRSFTIWPTRTRPY